MFVRKLAARYPWRPTSSRYACGVGGAMAGMVSNHRRSRGRWPDTRVMRLSLNEPGGGARSTPSVAA